MNAKKTVSLLAIVSLMVGCSTQKTTSQTNTLTSLSDVNQHIAKTLFNYVDKDKDAKITKDEFVNYSNEKNQLQELKQVQSMIASCDKNGDQQISLDELPNRDAVPQVVNLNEIQPKEPCYLSKYEFSAKDSNHDDILTTEELLSKKIVPYPIKEEVNSEERDRQRDVFLKKHYESCDKNSDGKLTLAEATTKRCRIPSEIFTQADSNKDNFLTLEEIKKSAEEQDNRTPLLAVPAHPIAPHVGLPSSMPVEIRMMIKMSQCDSNKDGKMSESEAVSCGFNKKLFQENDINKDGFFGQEDIKVLQVIRQFKRIDQNHDGYLDINEFQKGNRAIYMPY